ncbi:DoxX family protein [Hymenobacter siberiensis]|uniref:DoxX family protein n=1 Tax=Hymenobacter siberiensis TaxID=2848396 RepID=UPI001C1DF664|nr:DoxX family protein [Hymenobacter siberiensis]MBU6122643.1 DoxX family protein [Hymenobacter siberiensis]
MSPSVRNVIAWILQALLAASFIYAGSQKLMGLDGTMAMFGNLGLPGWFGGFIGVAEVLGGIGLLVPRTVRPAALGLIVIMLGAVFMHATKIPGGLANGIPAIVTLVLLVIVLVLRSRTAARAAA